MAAKPLAKPRTWSRLISPWLAFLSIAVGLICKEVDLVALRIPFCDLTAPFTSASEPTGCIRLKGPIGAEDAVVLPGDPPILIVGELDAAAHELTSRPHQGTSASTSPRGTLWALDRLLDTTPRLTPLDVPLPDDVTTMHIHGLGLHGDVLFGINHAFAGGGERIERWRVTRRPTTSENGPPVTLQHLSSVTGHGGNEKGHGAWTFTSRLNAALNDIAPVGPHEFYMTQFMDAPASLEGAGSGTLTGFTPDPEEPLARAYRALAAQLGSAVHAKTMLPRLRRSRVWHCHCAAEGGEADADACAWTACEAVGPVGTCWNGIAYRANPNPTDGFHGFLYVNDIFRRIVVEFAVRDHGDGARLEQNRTFLAPYMVDNVQVDAASGAGLWIGAVGFSHTNFWGGLAALQANATAAHAAATAAGRPTPQRPHVHLRPSPDEPPQPPMTSGALHIDLASGEVTTRLLQSRQLASVSWSHGIGERIVMGSPWDDGVLICPAAT